MNFTPNEIQNLVFRKSVMGFNEDMVTEVLEKVTEDYTTYIKEIVKYKDKIEVLNESLKQYNSMKDTLQNSIIMAQQASEDIISNAQNKADNIIKDAEMRAKEMLEQASSEVLKIKFEYENLKKQMEVYKIKIESTIRAQLKMLETEDNEKNF